MEANINELRGKFPGREPEIELLTNTYSNSDLPYPPLTYFWGSQYTAKTKLTLEFFKLIQNIKLVYLDFNLIIDNNQLVNIILKSFDLNGVGSSIRDLGQLLKIIGLNYNSQVKTVFILDHCKNYKLNYLNQFIYLSREFDHHLIIISNLPSYQLFPANQLHTPIDHHFLNYSKLELSKILSIMNPQPTKELELRYEQFNIQYLLPIIFNNCKNLKIINEFSLLLINKLNINGGGVINLNKVKLLLSKLNLFDLNIKDNWAPINEDEDDVEEDIDLINSKIIESNRVSWIDELIPLNNSVDINYKINDEVDETFNLPIITKLVLMSSYIASYNKSKFDSKLFTSQTGKMKKRGRRSMLKDQKAKQLNQKLLGPQPFTIIRLNLIFENLKNQINSTINEVNLLLELNKLKAKRLISNRGIGNTKWQCEISYNYSELLFNELGLNINHYLIIED